MSYLTRGRESVFNSSQLISRDLNCFVELFPRIATENLGI